MRWRKVTGKSGIGHTRYLTQGVMTTAQTQPFTLNSLSLCSQREYNQHGRAERVVDGESRAFRNQLGFRVVI